MKRKVLLMGLSGSGKTSMRSIIFANYPPRDTARLGPTYGFENTDVKFLGNLVLNLWDCGAQDTFMDNYFESQRAQIFRGVEVLIYVFDVGSQDPEKDMQTFLRCLSAIEENSKDARVFCLIHKMDLIQGDDMRRAVFQDRARALTDYANVVQITCFGTSIWDETLYKAWSAVVYSLVPDVDRMSKHLTSLRALCGADEIILFETATFLVIASAQADAADSTSTAAAAVNATAAGAAPGALPAVLAPGEGRRALDPHRHEKVSNVIKQFKLACARSQCSLVSLDVSTPTLSVLLETFTSNTSVMAVITGPEGARVQPAAVRLNLQAARPLFERFVNN